MELNPNHKVLRVLHDQWHVVVAMLVMKHGTPLEGGLSDDRELTITLDDIKAFGDKDKAIAVIEIDSVLHLKLIDRKAGMELARKEGGLPT